MSDTAADVAAIRQWRDEHRPTLGPDAAGTPALAAAWRKIDALLTKLDQVPAAIDWMWRDHQCQRPDLEAIVRDLIDPDECDLDHHGYCQAHGWLQEGECPHAWAKALLAGE